MAPYIVDQTDYSHRPLGLARSIKDPIHEYIPISPLLTKFIDTLVFQRLRDIKQLGTSSYVWPSASHNRFEHSLGVAYLARLMAEHFQKTQPELKITDRDVCCVEIAGLCHDLGHGPWSHVWDGLFIPTALKDHPWKHEDGSEMMFDYIMKNDVSLPEEDRQFVKALIAGDPLKCSPQEKHFLFDIVANKRNGLDVDKFDYIQRDSHMIGDPIRLSLPRIINSARILDDQICYDIKDANQIYEICATRFKLHKIIYNHKAAKAIEYMVIDGLLKADPHWNIAQRVFKPEEYIHLTDNIMPRIESSKEPELAEARAIFRRIRVRDLYKCVDYKVIDWPMRNTFRQHITPAQIVSKALSIASSVPASGGDEANSTPDCPLEVDDVIVDFSTMHYGMKEKNPLDFVKFYSKRNPHMSAKAERGDYSNLMPQYFAEDLLRVYTKKPQYFGLVQAGYRAVLSAVAERADISMSPDPRPTESVLAETTLTPPATEAPSTPPTHSRTGSGSFGRGDLTNTPFSNNSFTTVSPSYVPNSPVGYQMKSRGRKRRVDDFEEASPKKKRG